MGFQEAAEMVVIENSSAHKNGTASGHSHPARQSGCDFRLGLVQGSAYLPYARCGKATFNLGKIYFRDSSNLCHHAYNDGESSLHRDITAIAAT